MKAVFGKRYMDIRVLDRPLPTIAPDEVLLRVTACGLCGTDLHLLRTREELTPLGHEMVGEIVECGCMVKDFRPGDTVAAEGDTMCGVCRECKSGHTERCRNLYQMNGQAGFAEYLALNRRALVRYEGMDPVTASLTEPATVSLILCQNANIGLTDKVVVMGGGVIGQMCVRIAKLMGASTVVFVGGHGNTPRGRHRIETAKRMGADSAFAADEQENIAEAVRDTLHGGAHSVIVTAPPKALPAAMDMCTYGGIVSVAGIDLGAGGPTPISVDQLVCSKLTIKATFTEPAMHFHTTLQLLREGKIPAAELVDRVFGFADAKEAITAAAEGTEPILKAVFKP